MTTTDPWQQPQRTADHDTGGYDADSNGYDSGYLDAGGNCEPDTYDAGPADTAVIEADGIGVDASWSQLVSAGGIYPVQTTAKPFQYLHPSIR